MDQRFVRFLLLSFVILFGGMWINSLLFPRRLPPKPVAQKEDGKEGDEKKPDEGPKPAEKEPVKPDEKKPEDKQPEEKPEPKIEAPAEPQIPEQWFTLGSMDPDEPYRMLVTLTNRGAAVARIELNSPQYRDVEDRTGYLGHVADPRERGAGCRVRVAGPGTPADSAGLRGETWTRDGEKWKREPGDLITKVDGETVLGPETLQQELGQYRPGQEITLTVKRGDRELELSVVLGRHPLQMMHPEEEDPLSLLMTLRQLDDKELKLDPDDVADPGTELKGLNLWGGNWTVDTSDRSAEQITFRRPAGRDLEIRKTFRLAKVPAESQNDRVFRAYHLEVKVAIKNTGTDAHKVAYQLDGPTGLPLEGTWFASKISPASGVAGFRDVLFSLGGSLQAIHTTEIANGKAPQPYKDFGDKPLLFAGVDTQYFAALLIPDAKDPKENGIAMAHALKVGPKRNDVRLTNVSCRLVSEVEELKSGESLEHDYTFYVGPKKPELVDQYGVGAVVYYGWPIWAFFAVPLVKILHALYFIPNYGIAIILLTVLVRGCMHPMSRKQALNAQKMQELQPEIKKIQEKYKKDLEARSKAQQELFRKHNYNPLGGCLLLFVQLPIFIGLYRALMVDVDLRGAALFTEQIRWCSNLAAPDMFWDWSRFMPDWVNQGQGMFGLGPFLNLLPIATVFLFNWQQKKMMPPPTDEQQAMQQKIMQYMMIFMGILFYKVASGLCIYFIASSLWGVAERQFLPKRQNQNPSPSGPQTRADAKADARAAAEREAKARAEREAKTKKDKR